MKGKLDCFAKIRQWTISVCLFRRIGRSIAFNIYAVAVIYVRFAALTLVIYLLAHWYFAEWEMVTRDREAGAAAASRANAALPSPSSLPPPPTPAHHGEL